MKNKNNIQIFPYYLSRLCGGSIVEFNKLNFSNLDKFIKQHNDIKNNLFKIKKEITDQLFILIPNIKEKEHRNIILTVKRDVHNLRNLEPKVILQIKPLITPNVREKLDKFINLIRKLKSWEEEKKIIYAERITEIHKGLLKLTKNELFLNGLLLSSSNFYKDLKFFWEKKHLINEKKINLTIIKYLSRFHFKTSPFSTFTSININKIGDKNNMRNSIKLKSFIRLNNYIFHYLKLFIQVKNEGVRSISLRLNNTLFKNKEDYVYLANDANKESVQRIRSTPFLDFLFKLFTEKKYLTFDILIKTIQSYTKALISTADIESYLKKLIDYDFIEYYWGISELDPDWNNKLINFLNKFKKNKKIKKTILRLKQVNQIVNEYPASSNLGRSRLIKKLSTVIQELAENQITEEQTDLKKQPTKDIPDRQDSSKLDNIFKIKQDLTFNLRPHQLIFEDAKHYTSFSIPKNKIKEIMEKISYIADSFSLNNHLLGDHENMFDYFSKKYGLNAKIELLRFYEDYSRERISKKNNFQNPYSKKRQNLIKKNLDKIISLIREEKQNFNKEIKLDEKHLKILKRDQILKRNKHLKKSLSAHVQIFKNNNNSMVTVINRTSLGYGKMFSRFLYMFNSRTNEIFRRWNKPSEEKYLYLENIDASNFNFNMHPLLMPSELEITSDQYNLSHKSHVLINDLVVTANKQTSRLELLHKTSNKKVMVFDLGFENLMGRSGLFNFLSSFLVIHCIQYQKLLERINEANYDDKYSINIQPRVIFENQIILQRKTWVFDKKGQPIRNPEESDADYFFRINIWRQKIGLPEEVFIQTEGIYHKPKNNKQIKNNASPDDYKPQYINFSNPYLLELFNKIISKTEAKILIVEMLPNSQQAFSINNKRYVTEFLFQWYN